MPEMQRLAYHTPRFVEDGTRLESGDHYYTSRIKDNKHEWYGRIMVFGKTKEKAEKLRNKIMKKLNHEKS